MFLVTMPIIRVLACQRFVVNDNQILRVLLLGCLCKIKRAGEDRLTTNDHHLVMSDGVLRVNIGWNAGMGDKISGSIFLPPLAFIKDDLYMDATSVGIHQTPWRWEPM